MAECPSPLVSDSNFDCGELDYYNNRHAIGTTLNFTQIILISMTTQFQLSIYVNS